MSKNKLRKFAEMETFDNVFQCSAADSDMTMPYHLAGKWRHEVFGNDNPLTLELGCGRGEYTVGLAQMFPQKNCIGIDIKGARMWAGAKQAILSGTRNAAFLRTNIEFITRFFSADEIEEIWITFPDPQMKKATKRLTSSYFMQRYQKIMRDGGLIHLKTDSPFLYKYTLEMTKANGYELLKSTDNLYKTETDNPILNLKTHYEQQWLDRGMSIKYLCFRLHHKQEFTEPEVDIEKDTYRSYGRNYHVSNQKQQMTTK